MMLEMIGEEAFTEFFFFFVNAEKRNTGSRQHIEKFHFLLSLFPFSGF